MSNDRFGINGLGQQVVISLLVRHAVQGIHEFFASCPVAIEILLQEILDGIGIPRHGRLQDAGCKKEGRSPRTMPERTGNRTPVDTSYVTNQISFRIRIMDKGTYTG